MDASDDTARSSTTTTAGYFCDRSDSSSETSDESSEYPGPAKKFKSSGSGRGGRGTGRFKKSWKFPFINASTRGRRFSYCKLCNSHFSVAHGGVNDVKRHCQGPGHLRKHSESERNASIAKFFEESSVAHSLTSKVTSAEVMMARFIAMHNLPFQAADHLCDLLPFMFPDSKIAAKFSSKHTKTKAIICDAIDPHLKFPVVELLKTSSFNLLCDESNERGDSVKLLTRMFEPSSNAIVTCHLDTIGITDFTAEGIFYIFEGDSRTSSDTIQQLTSDTCNVMKGARGGVIAKLRSIQPNIININCICHLVNLCVKSATKVLPLHVDELLVDIYYHFRNSVSRITALQEYAEFCSVEYKSVLKHCETRWLSLQRAIDRTLEIWDALL